MVALCAHRQYILTLVEDGTCLICIDKPIKASLEHFISKVVAGDIAWLQPVQGINPIFAQVEQEIIDTLDSAGRGRACVHVDLIEAHILFRVPTKPSVDMVFFKGHHCLVKLG